jgi:hypothetical protein
MPKKNRTDGVLGVCIYIYIGSCLDSLCAPCWGNICVTSRFMSSSVSMACCKKKKEKLQHLWLGRKWSLRFKKKVANFQSPEITQSTHDNRQIKDQRFVCLTSTSSHFLSSLSCVGVGAVELSRPILIQPLSPAASELAPPLLPPSLSSPPGLSLSSLFLSPVAVNPPPPAISKAASFRMCGDGVCALLWGRERERQRAQAVICATGPPHAWRATGRPALPARPAITPSNRPD